MREAAPFGVCLIREGSEVGAPALPEPVGCIAHIVRWDMPQLGVLQIVVQGAERFRVVSRYVQADGLTRATVELLPEAPDEIVPARFSGLRTLLERIAAEHGERIFAAPFQFESSAWIGARLSEVLPLPNQVKQQLLEMDGVRRLDMLGRLIEQKG